MREIKFRGKHIESGEWLYGSHYDDCGEEYILPNLPGSAVDYEDYQVDPNTVGQYTGLKDKNGKEIYEGDILDSLKGRFVIGWGNEHCGFEVLQPCRGKLLYLSNLYEDMTASEDATEYEPDKSEWEWSIIGNIHDNPELLGTTN